MPTVKLRFPGGRYHATPWGHHVNEGLIEWPPCPWRLLRALLATGFSSQGWTEPPPVARRLIEKLASTLPMYRLPPASAAHSRHYMPYIEGRTAKTTLVFDAWANVGDGEMFVRWPVDLDAEEFELLRELLLALNYLGRSESWVEAQLTDEIPAEWNAVPCLDGVHVDRHWEQVSLMAAIPPPEYANWREAQVEEALRPFQNQKSSAAMKKKQKQAIEPFPADLTSCLTKDSAWWKSHGWSQPPGSQRVLYRRRSDSLQVGVPTAPRRFEPSAVESFLLAMSSPSGNTSALPHATRTLPQAEHIRRALICRAADGARIDCPSLLGRANGEPIRGAHEHAHFIPLDLDGDQFLDHILIYAPGKLCGAAQRAIRRLKRSWTKGGVGDLQLAVVGSGNLDALRNLRRFPASIEALLGPREGALAWESVTPFVPPRFLKRRGSNTIEGQVQAELASRGKPAAERIEVLPELSKELRHYVRSRSRGGTLPKTDVGYGIRLHFAKPIAGPLLLGYASHFGLGRFAAIPK